MLRLKEIRIYSFQYKMWQPFTYLAILNDNILLLSIPFWSILIYQPWFSTYLINYSYEGKEYLSFPLGNIIQLLRATGTQLMLCKTEWKQRFLWKPPLGFLHKKVIELRLLGSYFLVSTFWYKLALDIFCGGGNSTAGVIYKTKFSSM